MPNPNVQGHHFTVGGGPATILLTKAAALRARARRKREKRSFSRKSPGDETKGALGFFVNLGKIVFGFLVVVLIWVGFVVDLLCI